LPWTQLAGAGFGLAGYDWPSQKADMLKVLDQLNLTCPLMFVNDGVPPLLAASDDGWGVSLIAGTGLQLPRLGPGTAARGARHRAWLPHGRICRGVGAGVAGDAAGGF
jgi:hypothetical protein